MYLSLNNNFSNNNLNCVYNLKREAIDNDLS